MSNGAPTFFIAEKRVLLMFMDNHHNDGRVALWCAAPPGAQEALIALDAERFFRPPYVGHRGYAGVRLDVRPDWEQTAAIIEDGYAFVAGKAKRR